MPTEREPITETKTLGDITIQRSIDGRILKINSLDIDEKDAVLIVQRHQKPASFSKEALLASAAGKENPKNLDYVYDPNSTETGAEQEKILLQKVEAAFGPMNRVATTPRQRGKDHAPLIQEQFPLAKQEESLGTVLDDSGLGLMGESQYGGEKYTTEETKGLFGGTGQKDARFGKGKDREHRKPLTYMESWVQHGYLPEKNPWLVENPEEFVQQTRQLIDKVDGKNFFITHEANILAMHLLAERPSAELLKILMELPDLPEKTRTAIEGKINGKTTFLDLYQAIRETGEATYADMELPAEQRGYHFTKTLADLLEKIKLKSGPGNRGYAALSIYTIRTDEHGKKYLLEAAFDQQV